MPDPDLERIHDLFDRAVDLEPETRAPFLERECKGDAALRREVEALIAAEEQAGQFLKEPSFNPDSAAAIVVGAETVGSQIGPYKLVQHLGDGGGGSVFLAEQDRPVKRRVALKVIRLGMDTREVIARFAAERQALAMMDHPGIAKVYDAGATATGRPFFAMELVDGGVAITKFCDQQKLGLRDRLRLFVHVCHAVQHAHHKGIIHRDLKPSNILVTMLDGKPYPTVIDFGIAKATTQRRIGEDTVRTEKTALVGTPTYMSPEQASIGGADVDTRSDIYSLGVLLYELLTGTTPFDPGSLHNATLADVQKMIRDVDPPKPSTRVSHRRDTLHLVASQRATAPATLRATMRGELDWIVMKCLEKQRSRRYDSANALAGDIEAFLDGRAVIAAPPSRLYLARKFIKRHAIGLAAAGAVAAAVTGGLVVSVISLQRTRIEQAKTIAALHEAERQQKEAETANAIAREVNRFLDNMLTKADPRQSRGKDLTVSAMLDRAAEEVAGRFADRPAVEAAIRETIGRSYSGLFNNTAAIAQLSRAIELRESLGRGHDVSSLGPRGLLASCLHQVGRFAESSNQYQILLDDALAILKSPGDDTLEALDVITDQQTPPTVSKQQLLEIVQLVAQRRARILGADAMPTLVAREAVATKKAALGDLAAAESELRVILDAYQKHAKPGDWRPSRCRFRLGAVLMSLGQDQEGIAMLKQSLRETDEIYGTDHPYPITVMQSVASILQSALYYEEALKLQRECVERSRVVYGEKSSKYWSSYQLLGLTLATMGRHAEAEAAFRKGVELSAEASADDQMIAMFMRLNLGRHLVRFGDAATAEPFLQEGINGLRALVRPDSPVLLEARLTLARSQLAAGKTESALEISGIVKERIAATTRPADAPAYARLLGVYGALLVSAQKHSEAEPMLNRATKELEATGQSDLAAMRAVLISLRTLYEQTNRPADALSLDSRIAALDATTRIAPKRDLRIDD